MSESKWTPGPWQIHHDLRDSWYKRRVYGEENSLVANIVNGPESEANARLIAAVPEVAEALEEAIRWIGRLTDWEGAGDPDIDKWRAALNKAKGEQS